MDVFDKLDRTFGLLAKGMDGSTLRQKVLVNNIANVDTPNFKGQDVNFYSQLKGMMGEAPMMGSLPMAKTNAAHLNGFDGGSGSFQISQTQGQVRPDGNNINIDAEMAKVAENTIYYSTLASTVAKKYKLLDNVISKGGAR